MIPYLCPELPQRQKEALHELVKAPLVYTSVALRNWEAFRKLGVFEVAAPGGYFSSFGLSPKVDIGSYRSSSSSQESILLPTRIPAPPRTRIQRSIRLTGPSGNCSLSSGPLVARGK